MISLQYIRHRKIFFAHDEKEEGVEGDVVMIKSCLPISKKKHFIIHEFLERAPRCTLEHGQKPDKQDEGRGPSLEGGAELASTLGT